MGHGYVTTRGWKCHTWAAPSCDIFNLWSSYFHVPRMTVSCFVVWPSTNFKNNVEYILRLQCRIYLVNVTWPIVIIMTAGDIPVTSKYTYYGIHTHPFNGPFPGLPRWASTRKVKQIWILLKQETVSGSGISWAVCKSAPRSRQITTPAVQHTTTQFFTGRMPFLPPNQQRQSTEGYTRNQLKY